MRYREISYQEKESKMNKGAVHQKRRNDIARQEGRPKKKTKHKKIKIKNKKKYSSILLLY